MKKKVLASLGCGVMMFGMAGMADASMIGNNIALTSLGAQAFDNGNWFEHWSGNYGFQYDAVLAIDDITNGGSFWAGLGSLPVQQIWIVFDKRYSIDAIYLDEMNAGQASADDAAYLTFGELEYLIDGSWNYLASLTKNTPDFMTSFSPITADGVRLNVYSANVPSGWTNVASCVYSFEVNAAPVPIPAAGWLLGSGIAGLIGSRIRRRNN